MFLKSFFYITSNIYIKLLIAVIFFFFYFKNRTRTAPSPFNLFSTWIEYFVRLYIKKSRSTVMHGVVKHSSEGDDKKKCVS